MYQRYFLRIAYDGSAFHGWQRQPNAVSVQEVLEMWIKRILHLPFLATTGCGRTDTGVHAKDFYLHLNPEKDNIDVEDLLYKLGHVLPKDIAVYDMFPVHPTAHTRFDASERAYEYHLHYRRDPFIKSFSTYCKYTLDIDKMNEACSYLIKTGDFAAFSRTGGGQKTTICDVRAAYWEPKENGAVFHIRADRFLRNMVRAIVGTMMEVGRGKMSIEEFEEVVLSCSRVNAGDSARPEGLHLSEISYPYIINGKYHPEKIPVKQEWNKEEEE
jgi:tRNA pseudouridine38-40 synthase